MPRVTIREPRPEDEPAFIAAVRASRSLHHPWTELPDTPDGFAGLVQRDASANDRVFLIVRAEDDALAGIATLSQIVHGHLGSAYLGYSAFAPLDGQGYMTEGLRQVLAEAFGPIGLHRVEANVQPDNERSLALVERLGFRREGYSPRYLKIAGEWRDHVRFALLAEEFAGE